MTGHSPGYIPSPGNQGASNDLSKSVCGSPHQMNQLNILSPTAPLSVSPNMSSGIKMSASPQSLPPYSPQHSMNISSPNGMNIPSPSPSGMNIASPGGMNIASPGGMNISSPGGMNISSPGGMNVASPGGLNIASQVMNIVSPTMNINTCGTSVTSNMNIISSTATDMNINSGATMSSPAYSDSNIYSPEHMTNYQVTDHLPQYNLVERGANISSQSPVVTSNHTAYTPSATASVSHLPDSALSTLLQGIDFLDVTPFPGNDLVFDAGGHNINTKREYQDLVCDDGGGTTGQDQKGNNYMYLHD